MRHAKQGGKLSRTSAHRKAMLRNLVTSLLDHERVETTDAKAKEVRRLADRMITLGKRGDLHARRQALSVIRRREVTAKVFGDLAERFRERPGGYTRVLKTRHRTGDAAAMSVVELVEGMAGPEPPSRKRKAAGKKATRKAAAAGGPAANVSSGFDEKATGRKAAAPKGRTSTAPKGKTSARKSPRKKKAE